MTKTVNTPDFDAVFMEQELSICLEFLELAAARSKADMTISPRSHEEILADLRCRLEAGACAPWSTAAFLCRMLLLPLQQLLISSNMRLRRQRRLMHFSRVREMDKRCNEWLARQPGVNLAGKLGHTGRILAVAKETGSDFSENRLVDLVVRTLTPLTESYLEKYADAPDPLLYRKDVRKFLSCAQSWRFFAESRGIRKIDYAPSPNNPLRYDRRYHPFWLAYRWLKMMEERTEIARKQLVNLKADVMTQLVAIALSELSSERLEQIIDMNEILSGERRFYSPLGVWVMPRKGYLGEVSIENIDAKVMIIEKNKCDQNETPRSLCATSIKEWSWMGLADTQKKYLEQLHTFLRVEHRTIPAVKEISDISMILLQIQADSIIRHDSTIKSFSLFAGSLPVTSFLGKEPLPPVTVYGDSASAELGLRSGPAAWKRKIDGGTCKGIGLHSAWLWPGRLEKILEERDLQESLCNFAGLIEEACKHYVEVKDLALAYPSYLIPAAVRALHSAMPLSFSKRWLVPVPVAVALGMQEDLLKSSKLKIGDLYIFADFDGERPDIAIMEWCKEESKSFWLRRELPCAFEAPQWSSVVYQLLKNALRTIGLPMTTHRFFCALHCLKRKTILEELHSSTSRSVTLWLDTACQKPFAIEIDTEAIGNACLDWIHGTKNHLGKFIMKCRESKKDPCRIIFSGEFANMYKSQVEEPLLDIPIHIAPSCIVGLGLRNFAKRIQTGQLTWKEYIPELELLVRKQDGREDWQKLFRNNKPLKPGEEARGEPNKCKLPSGSTCFSLPLRRDQQKEKFCPMFNLSAPCSKDLNLTVSAVYETAGRGLVVEINSEDTDILPWQEMHWERIKDDSRLIISEIPQPQMPSSAPVVQASLEKFTKQLKDLLEKEEDSGVLNSRLQSLSSEFRAIAGDTREEIWKNINKHKEGMAVLSDVICCFAMLSGLKQKSLSSRVIGTLKTRVSHKIEQKTRGFSKDLKIVNTSLSALGTFRAAAPRSLINEVKNYLNKKETSDNSKKVCIRVLGRVSGSWGWDEEAKSAIQLICDGCAGDDHIVEWCKALTDWTNGHPEAMFGMHAKDIDKLCSSFIGKVKYIDFENCKKEYCRDLLRAILSLRHATRRPEDGMKCWGPSSKIAKELSSILREASRKAKDSKTIFPPLGLKQLNSNAPIQDNPFLQVAEAWDGKITVLPQKIQE